jgi:Transposase IS116/IS110/IS902 family.
MSAKKANEIKAIDRQFMRELVRTRQDIQSLRIRTNNRVKNRETVATDDYIMEQIDDAMDFTENEKTISKQIETCVRSTALWNGYLADVKGVGAQIAAVIISEIDIEKATTVSKLWQYAGLNPNMVPGQKLNKDGKRVVTTTMVRGDRPTAGFVLPYNKFLKAFLLQNLADCFIRSNSPYRKFYDDYKNRLEHSKKKCANTERIWAEESAAHRDRAARRYMVKMFLIDLHKAWRTIEGLPVRDSYQKEYLGHEHNSGRVEK